MTAPTTSLNNALLIAASGLNANQVGLGVVSQNVANSQVTGYTTESAPLETIVTGGLSSGVRTLAVTTNINQALLRQVQNANSTSSQYTTVNTFLQAFQNNFGTPGSTTNIVAQIGNLENAFSALTVNPNDPTAQSQVVTAAQNLAQQFNQIGDNINQVREQADSQIATSVNNVNTALNQVYSLNQQIVALQAQGLSTANLQDQRNNEISAIAQEMNISTSVQSNGAIYIQTGNGVSLLDSTYNPANPQVTFSQTPVVSAQSAYYPPPSSSLSTFPLSGVKINGVDVTSDITSGNIAGDLYVRDTLMPQTQSQLDELGAQLITQFNTNDLQLFQAGTGTLPSADQVQSFTNGVAGTTASSITVQAGGTSGLSVGMSMQFASQPGTTYQITNIAGNTISFVTAGSGPGPTTAPATDDNVTFGPAIPQISVGAAASAGSTTVTLAGAVGAQIGMRIKFANDTNIYTISNVTTNASGQQVITVQADGGGTTSGLSVAVTSGEAISFQPPVTGLVGLSQNITVNPIVISNPWRVSQGTRVAQQSTVTGNNTLPTNIVDMFNTQQTFTPNTGLGTKMTLQNFATSAVAYQANATATAKANLDSASTIYTSLNQQFQNQDGVNVDQQLANMIQIQSSYEASARTITAIQDMMNQLLQAVQ